MKKSDIERMISLADDRYIDEIFQDKITGRRKNIFVTFTAVAAALALVAGGISYLVSNAGNSDKITANDPIISEVGAVDYRSYFQNYDESAVEVDNDEWSIESAGIFCYFSNSESEYVKSVMPFDMGGFVNADCNFYYDHKDELKTISIYANDKADDSQENVKMLYIDAHREGEFFPHLQLENCKSMKRFDVDVYGFDLLETDNTLGVLFASNGREYLISGDHMSYDEIGVIMDSIIINGLWADRFDLSKAEMEYYDIRTGITLAEANEIAPFAGYVPNIENIGGMNIGSSKGAFYYAVRNENNEAVPASLTITYSSSDMDGGWNDEIHNDMVVVFYTDKANVKPFKNIFKLEDAENVLSEWKIPGIVYAFTIDCGNFMINIETENCSDNELLSYITDIRIGANGVLGNSSREISLAEADTIVPFAGYVPQIEDNGTLYLYRNVTYVVEKNNGKNIWSALYFSYADYSNESNRILFNYFTSEKNGIEAFDNIVNLQNITQESLDNFIIGDEYSFTINCNDFMINVTAECTSEQLWKYIETIKDNGGVSSDINSSDFDFTPFGTLADANMLEPFAGYVPTVKVIGDMEIYTGGGSEVMSAETEEDGRMLRINYQSEVKSGNVYGEYDFKSIGAAYTEKKYYIDTTDPVISADQLPFANLDELKTDGIRGGGRVCYRFIIDCGTCYISVAADCLPEEMEQFIREINGSTQDMLTLAEAKAIEPFGVYVPARESGSMKLEKGVLNYNNKNGRKEPLSLHFTFSEGTESLVFDYQRDTADFSQYPDENIIPIENIDWSTVNNFVETKTSFVLDCGKVKLLVDADCPVEQVWYYIDQIKGAAMFDAAQKAGKLITMDEVKELSKKGDDLTWSDFESYYGVDVGSGLYIMAYHVEGTDYIVYVGGGSLNEKPMYINLGRGNGNHIDIRYDSVDDFLS